jgi:hypothetical protein
MRWSCFVAIAFSLLLPAQEPRNPKAQEYVRAMGRGEGKLKAGDDAVDFDLAYAGGKSGRVQLAKFFGKRPVALIFGSFT